jgi:hypothetical protein
MKFMYYAMTMNQWGAGLTQEEAVKNMNGDGTTAAKKHGYIVHKFSKLTTIDVSPIDGRPSVEQGVTADVIHDSRKVKAI